MFAFDNPFVSGISEGFTQTYLQVLLLISYVTNHYLVFVGYCLDSVLVCQLKMSVPVKNLSHKLLHLYC